MIEEVKKILENRSVYKVVLNTMTREFDIQSLAEEICQLKPDRPELREKLNPALFHLLNTYDAVGTPDYEGTKDQLLALIPDKFEVEDEFVQAFAKGYRETHEALHKKDIEEALTEQRRYFEGKITEAKDFVRKQERDRILNWRYEICSHNEAYEKRECDACWQALKGGE